MEICLKSASIIKHETVVPINIEDRLPEHINGPCELQCIYKVKDEGDYFLVNMQVSGPLTIECQRCLEPFTLDYKNSSELAVCRSESFAEKLLSRFDNIVVPGFRIDLASVVTDELHLYTYNKHSEVADCSLSVEVEVVE